MSFAVSGLVAPRKAKHAYRSTSWQVIFCCIAVVAAALWLRAPEPPEPPATPSAQRQAEQQLLLRLESFGARLEAALAANSAVDPQAILLGTSELVSSTRYLDDTPLASTQDVLQRLRFERAAAEELVRDQSMGRLDPAMYASRYADLLRRLKSTVGDLRDHQRRHADTGRGSFRPLPLRLLVGAVFVLAVLASVWGWNRGAPRLGAGLPAGGGWTRRSAPRLDASVRPGPPQAEMSQVLPHLADWVLLCDANGRVDSLLHGDAERLGITRGTSGHWTLGSLTSGLAEMTRELLPEPGASECVTLTHFGTDADHAIPVRLVVRRVAGGAYLAVARDRSDEVAVEEEIRAKSSQLARFKADSEALQQKVLQLEEQQHLRMGQELHDGIGQQLAGIAFLATALSTRLQRSDVELSGDARWIAQLANQAMESCRSLSHQLSFPLFTRGQIDDTLGRLCEEASGLYRIECIYAPARPDRAVDCVPADVTRHLIRVTQEAINNAIRHGHAARIVARLERVGGDLRLAIANLRPAGAAPLNVCKGREGLGINSMKARAAEVDGTLRFRCGTHGAAVFLRVPARALCPSAPRLGGMLS